MSAWKNFATKMKAKRTTRGKKQGGSGGETVKEEIVVQRMSSEVSGKAQKYCRIGPREFVPFQEYEEELTLENIVLACQKHFTTRIERGMVCDVLAGEQGPSCRKLVQIPDLKVIHIRFVKPHDLGAVHEGDISQVSPKVNAPIFKNFLICQSLQELSCKSHSTVFRLLRRRHSEIYIDLYYDKVRIL